MKRWLSITVICALLASPAAQLIAASCPHAAMAKACHRVQHAHHCDMMEEEARTSNAEQSGVMEVDSDSASQNCPMDCCSPGQRSSAVVVPAIVLISSVVVAGQSLPFTPTVFCTS